MRNFSLIPFVCSAGGQVAGSERAGVDLKDAGFVEALQKAGIAIDWQVDPREIYAQPFGAAAHEALPPLGSAARKAIVVHHCRWLKEQVEQASKAGFLPVTIGGDHAMALASIGAVAAAGNALGDTGVIWVDAHADINTPATSPSQALHGMPLAALLGMGDSDYLAVAGGKPVLTPQNLVYVGLRDVDAGERNLIKEMNIANFTMDDIARLGLEEVLGRAREIIGHAKAKVISIDLDAFDPREVPSVGSPAPGGLKVAETLPLLQKLVEATDFDLIEISEYNPALGGRDRTYAFLQGLMKALLAPVSRRSYAA